MTQRSRDATVADPSVRDLVTEIRDTLESLADPLRARAQQRYMKSAMPFYGIAMPDLRRTVTTLVSEPQNRLDAVGWKQGVLLLWDGARHREERYAALVLARHRLYRTPAQRVASLSVYEHLVRTGAWWDLVDETSHLVGGVLATHREEVSPIMRDWARDDDVWVRRAAILSQLDHRELTDTDLLYDCIEPSLDDPEFFARKAIGWALRQYARVDPDWVRSVVILLDDRLAPLSRREALKNIG